MVWGAGWEGGGAVGWVTPPILGRTRSVGGGRPRRTGRPPRSRWPRGRRSRPRPARPWSSSSAPWTDVPLLAGHGDPQALLGVMRWSWSSAASSMSSWTQLTVPVKRLVAGRVVVAHRRAGVGADVAGLVGRVDHRDGGVDPPVADLGAVDEEGDVAALGQARRRRRRTPCAPGGCRPGPASSPATLNRAGRAGCSSTSGLPVVQVQASSPANAPPWAMITPLAPPSGTSISAVTECDLFLRLRTEFSVSRPMPPKSSWTLPVTSVGPPGEVGVEALDPPVVERAARCTCAASMRNSRCSSASFSGCSAARSWAWVQSVLVS